MASDLPEKAVAAARTAAMVSLGYAHGDRISIGGVVLDVGKAVREALAAALPHLGGEPVAHGAPFDVGDLVETVKGAKFWGRVASVYDLGEPRFAGEPAGWRCDVLAIDPGFSGTLHVYPATQLRLLDLALPVAPVTLGEDAEARLAAADPLSDLERTLLALLKGEHSSLILSFNDMSAPNYNTVAEFEDNYGPENSDAKAWVSPEEHASGRASNRCWRLQWYPHTPVGFHSIQASTLVALFRALSGGAS